MRRENTNNLGSVVGMPLCPHYSSIVFDNQRNRNKERRLMENLKLELI